MFGHYDQSFLLSVNYLIKENLLVYNQGDKARVIQTLLFVAGIKTLLQALFGTRLPAVVGGSFAYVVPIAYIISDSKLQRITDHHEVSNFHCTLPSPHGQCVRKSCGIKYIHRISVY